MKLRGKCSSCRKTKWFLMKQTINLAGIGEVISDNELCLTCRRGIKKVKIHTDEEIKEKTISN